MKEVRRRAFLPLILVIPGVLVACGRKADAGELPVPRAIEIAKKIASEGPELNTLVWNGDLSLVSLGFNAKAEIHEDPEILGLIDVGFVVEKSSNRANFTYRKRSGGMTAAGYTAEKTKVVLRVNPEFATLDSDVQRLVVRHASLQVGIWEIGNSIASGNYIVVGQDGFATTEKIVRTFGMMEYGNPQFQKIQKYAAALPMMRDIGKLLEFGTNKQKQELQTKTILARVHAQAALLKMELRVEKYDTDNYFRDVAYGEGKWREWVLQQK